MNGVSDELAERVGLQHALHLGGVRGYTRGHGEVAVIAGSDDLQQRSVACVEEARLVQKAAVRDDTVALDAAARDVFLCVEDPHEGVLFTPPLGPERLQCVTRGQAGLPQAGLEPLRQSDQRLGALCLTEVGEHLCKPSRRVFTEAGACQRAGARAFVAGESQVWFVAEVPRAPKLLLAEAENGTAEVLERIG